jgi:hypothetical protein
MEMFKKATINAAFGLALSLTAAGPARAATPALTWGTALQFYHADHGYLPTVAAGYTGSTLAGNQYVSVHQGAAGASSVWWDYITSNTSGLHNQNTVGTASNRLTPSVALLCANGSTNTFIEVEEDTSNAVYARLINKTISGTDSWTGPVQITQIPPSVGATNLAIGADGSGGIVITYASFFGTYYLSGQASTGGGCEANVTPSQLIWYTPQLLDGGNQFGATTVALAPVYSEVEGQIDLVIAADLTHDVDAVNYFTGCFYASPSNNFSKPEPGDGSAGGPRGTIGCGFTTARKLPNATDPLSVSTAIASINGTINSEAQPGSPAAFATIVFNENNASCPPLYSETAIINNNSVCTYSSADDECLPNSSVSLTWSGSHKYGCGFSPQISYPNQIFLGDFGAPKAINGIEVHADSATNLWQIPMTLTH